jgi:predicted house-cleaning noncanonical NTP pyrophosphatase (MazG superfamily)
MKKSTIIIRSASCLLTLGLSQGMGIPEAPVLGFTTDSTLQQDATVARQNTVKIALLLDTSNSMDGLINQAKAQLWDIVNQFSHVHCQDDRRPGLQIALYQYGNDDLSPGEGYIRQVTGFTGDLDELSEKLFSLSTNGGEEFCGQVIQASLGQLDWGKDPRDLKIIFIAGNEPFTQGRLDYRDAVANAREKDVIVNTIFCGDYSQGVNSRWKEGAQLGGGEYMAIDHNQQAIHIATPYDEIIIRLNSQLNGTYISYGPLGTGKRAQQAAQDANAMEMEADVAVKRAVSKSSRLYSNESWDLVDAAAQPGFSIAVVKEDELPAELRNKSEKELQKYIELKQEERISLQNQIQEVNKKREAYIREKQKSEQGGLESAMIQAIKKQALKKDYHWR